MTDEGNPDNPSSNKQAASASEAPSAPATPAQREIPRDSGKRTDGQHETAKELAREFRWVEAGQLIVNGCLAIIGIMALCIFTDSLRSCKYNSERLSSNIPNFKNPRTPPKAPARALRAAAILARPFADILRRGGEPSL